MSSKPKKYIFVNGIMQQNPEYLNWVKAHSDPSSTSNNSHTSGSSGDTLAVVSSLSDIAEATAIQSESTGTPMQMSDSTISAMENMQDDTYLNSFHSNQELDGGELLEGLTDYFIQYEVPVGLISKLSALRHYRLNFIVDDSGSMRAPTDVMLTEGCPSLFTPPSNGQPAISRTPNVQMTRWQEAENRLHVMLDILAYIPTYSIQIQFLNAENILTFNRTGKSIDDFKRECHDAIRNTFASIDVRYKTPTYTVLSKAFQEASKHSEPTMHYLLTDGVPTDRPVHAVSELIINRAQPDKNPVTFLSCSNEDSEVEWMKQVEEVAPFTAELDDYNAEKIEVLTDQGPAFPFTKGLWMVAQLVAAINPMDLDALDENLPFSKYTMDNLLGRTHTSEEYRFYFERNPHASLYVDVYSRFLNEKVHARNIISEAEQRSRESQAGYVDGKPTRSVGNVSHMLSQTHSQGSNYSSATGGLPPPPAYNQPPPAYAPPPGAPPAGGQSRQAQVLHYLHRLVLQCN